MQAMQISFAGTRRNKGDMNAMKQERQERMQKSMPQVEVWHDLAGYSLSLVSQFILIYLYVLYIL